jgi:hypothetical protein
VPSGTTSSSPTTTSFATKSHSESSARTGSASATHPNTAPAGSNASSKRLATSSRSTPPNRQTQNKPPKQPTTPAGLPPTQRRQTTRARTRSSIRGIHRSASSQSNSAAHQIDRKFSRSKQASRVRAKMGNREQAGSCCGQVLKPSGPTRLASSSASVAKQLVGRRRLAPRRSLGRWRLVRPADRSTLSRRVDAPRRVGVG